MKRALLVLAFVLWALPARADDDPPQPPPPPPDPTTAPPIPEPVSAPPEPIVPGEARSHFEQTPPLGLLPTGGDALIDPRMARSWGVAPWRWFLATTVDVGFVYARPRLSAGYGKPFTSWFGADINPIITGNGLGAYGGLRVEVPFVDIRVGARFMSPFNRRFLNAAPSYDRINLETEGGEKARVLTYEAEIDASFPAGPGNIIGRASLSYITGVPNGKYVFEEALRVIADPPWVWRIRGGYVFRLGKYSQHGVGVVADVLDSPGREDSRTVRAGPILRWVLSRRVEVRGSFVLTVYSPDRIGLVGSDFTELGVRYRWATE